MGADDKSGLAIYRSDGTEDNNRGISGNMPGSTVGYSIGSPFNQQQTPQRRNVHRSQKSQRRMPPRNNSHPPSRSSMDRDAFIHTLNSSSVGRPSPSRDMKSPAAFRDMLKDKFFEAYFSQGNAFPGWEFMIKCAHSSPAMRLILDAAFLAVVGSQTKEPRMLMQAHKSYCRALVCFRNELERPSAHLLPVAHALLMCEMFSAISSDGKWWQRHADGILYIMKNCKREDGPSGYVGAVLTSSVRVPFALWHGLRERKTGTNVEKLYSKDFAGPFRVPGSATHFHALSKRVPGLLQRADEVCAKGRKADSLDVVNVLNEIAALEELMHNWMTEWLATMKYSPYRTTALEKLEPPTTIAHAGDPSVFPHAYFFTTGEKSIILLSYWMCLLNLRHSHLDVRTNVGEELYPLRYGRTQLKRLTRDTYECADNLCMSCAYLTLPMNGYLGLMATMAPLQFAHRWYKAANDAAKIEWCRKAANALQSRGLCIWTLNMDDNGGGNSQTAMEANARNMSPEDDDHT